MKTNNLNTFQIKSRISMAFKSFVDMCVLFGVVIASLITVVSVYQNIQQLYSAQTTGTGLNCLFEWMQ